jgi:hypothetical protein
VKAILSSSIIFEPGIFKVSNLTIPEAKEWVKNNNPTCFSTHDTVKILGVTPAKSRLACNSYVEALCLKPNQRLDFHREYSLAEMEEIGVTIFLIKRMTK